MTIPRLRTRVPAASIFVLVLMMSIGWPVLGQVSVNGDLTHEFEMLPGSTHSGTIVIQNNDTAPAEVKLYQTDYRTEPPGQSFYDSPGSNPRSNAAWVSISPMRFTIPPGETYTITYVLEVPPDPDLSGSYWSLLMIEAIPPESPESIEAENEIGLGIMTLVRYAVGLVTHIGTTGTIQPEIENASLALSGDVPTLRVDIRNSGTRLFNVEIRAELYNADGTLVAIRDGVSAKSYPSSARRQEIPLGGVPPGQYTALVIIDAGDNNVFGATLSIRLE